MKEKNSIYMNNYNRELFNQYTPYLQLLKAQQKDLSDRLGKKQFSGTHVYMLPFSSCMDEVEDIFDKVREKYGINDINEVKDGIMIFYRDKGFVDEYAKYEICDCFDKNSEIGILYADEDYLGTLEELYGIEESDFDIEILKEFQKYSFGCKGYYRGEPWFKPDFSPDTLESFFYFGSLIAVRGDIFAKSYSIYGKLSLYQFIRQAVKICEEIYHVDKVLYTNEDILRSRELPGYEKKNFEIDCEQPLISIIIPSKDNSVILKKCISSLIELTSYAHYEIVIVDNGSSKEEKMCIESFVEQIRYIGSKSNLSRIEYLYDKMPFNFSKMCNIGAEASLGEYLLFLNDDIEIIDSKWLKYMLYYAAKRHTGAVGAKLYYPKAEESEYKIQHAGITNMAIGPAHKLGGRVDKGNLYHGHNMVNYNMLAVTGACLLVNKEKYYSVGGFDEKLAVAYNDVDLCFKLYEKGFYNVQVNLAVLVHHESLSRGSDVSTEKEKRLNNEKEILYKKHPKLYKKDPFYNINLVQNKKDIDYNVNYEFAYDKKATVTIENSHAKEKIEKAYLKYKKQNEKGSLNIFDKLENRFTGVNLLMFNVDKVSYEMDDIIIDGWYVLQKHDNAQISRDMLIYSTDEKSDIMALYSANMYPCLREDVDNLFKEDSSTTNTRLAGIHMIIDKNQFEKGLYALGIRSKINGKEYISFVKDIKVKID